jgi:hypothetical protein
MDIVEVSTHEECAELHEPLDSLAENRRPGSYQRMAHACRMAATNRSRRRVGARRELLNEYELGGAMLHEVALSVIVRRGLLRCVIDAVERENL